MTTTEAKDFLEMMLEGLRDDNTYVITTDASKLKDALRLAVCVMGEKLRNATEKPFRNPSVERKGDNRAKILNERLKALNGRFFELEQAVEKLSVDLNILRDRFDSHIWERHDED